MPQLSSAPPPPLPLRADANLLTCCVPAGCPLLRDCCLSRAGAEPGHVQELNHQWRVPAAAAVWADATTEREV